MDATDQLAVAIAAGVAEAVGTAVTEAMAQARADAAPVTPAAYSIADAAARLAVSTRTLHRLAEAKAIHTVRIGTRTVIPATEIERILQGDQ